MMVLIQSLALGEREYEAINKNLKIPSCVLVFNNMANFFVSL
jgi:hypothetical protein